MEALNKKININKILELLKKVSWNLRNILNNIQNKYIPLIESVNDIISIIKTNKLSERLNRIIEKVKSILGIILPIVDEKIIPIINYIYEEYNNLKENDFTSALVDKIKIPINSLEIMKNIKKKYIKFYEK